MRYHEGRVIVANDTVGQTHIRPTDRSTKAQQDLWVYLAVRLGFQIGHDPVGSADSRYFVVLKETVEGGETRFSIRLRPDKKIRRRPYTGTCTEAAASKKGK